MKNQCQHPMVNCPKLNVWFVAPKTAEKLKGIPFETPVIVDVKMQEGIIHLFRPTKCRVEKVEL